MAAARPVTVVALSGGVDSATAAALLVEAGELVVGATMLLHEGCEEPMATGARCCGPGDVEDARRVAAHLGIPLHVIDLSRHFRATVVADFVAEHAAGRTPNPCVRCNEQIKLGPLLDRALALGADRLATGHYARIVERDGRRLLARGRDGAKDQSYFLHAIPRAALDRLRFPVGELRKEEVRRIADRLGIPVAGKRESQEICFIPDGDHGAYLDRRLPAAPGDIVDADGRVLGRHRGVHHFTIGQRQGLGFLGPPPEGEAPAPRYVVATDAVTRRVVVGGRQALEVGRLRASAVRWWRPPEEEMRLLVQIRHRHAARPATVRPIGGDGAEVFFDEPERGVAPGQAAVFYDGDCVVGGGTIHRGGDEMPDRKVTIYGKDT